MRRRDVHLSPWSLDLDRDPIREPPRPLALRHENYEDEFDFTTVFYDCFWSAAGDAIVLIGPPLINLEKDLDLAIIACPSMARCKFALRHRFLGCQVIAKAPRGTTGLVMRTGTSETFIAPQPNLSELFRNRRTAVTLSRDNDRSWIRDWAVFNKSYHKCDGILIYDNNTAGYGINDIYDCLAPIADRMQIAVLSWPFKYGVADWRLPISYGMLDSLYCQAGMLEHARHRFLAHARSVLNTDIDELVITAGGASVFELVERAPTGLLVFGGAWVENHPMPSAAKAGRPPRHKDFAWVRTGDRVGCENKWAVVPARVPQAAQWHVHRILGMPASDCPELVEMRHFKAINTNWTVDQNRSRERRTATAAIDPRSLRLDQVLQETLERIFPEESSAIPGDGARPPQSAYAWRVRGGRLAAAQRWREAGEAVESAASLMPEHPGFRLILATLQEHEKDDDAARDLRAQAEALHQRDPWYHLQRGRWLRDEGDPVEAHRAFARAIELDPKFTVAYHEMARNQFHCGYRGRPAKADQILKACAREVPDDALTRALLAKELERKGRVHDALEQVEVAVALRPENPHYHCLHARVLRQVGRFRAAEQAARQGIAADDLSARMDAFGRESVTESWREYQWRAPAAPELQAELAEILAAKGDWAAAEAAARDALARARTDPERHHRLSEILAQRGRDQEAAAALEAAIALARQAFRRPTLRDRPLTDRSRSVEARAHRLSRILRAAGRRDEAIAVLREALATVPDSGVITAQLATLLAEGGASDAAATLLRAALPKRPEDARLRFALSRILETANPPEAIALAKVAADLEPDNPTFQDHLVKLLLAAERTDEAARALAEALPRNARHGPLYFRASRLMQAARRSEDAIAAARRAVALDTGRARWHDHLAALLVEAGRSDEAEAVLCQALEGKVESGGICFRLSRLWQRHRPQQARALARRAVVLEPRKPYPREHLVGLLIESGDEAEAEAALRDALECHPGHAALHFQHSTLLQQHGRLEQAVGAARRAVELEPWRPRWRDRLAALLIEAGRSADAEAELRQALDQKVESGGMYFRLSRLLEEQCPQDAVAAVRRGVELEPHKPYLHERLAELLLQVGEDAEAEAVLRDALGRHPGYAALHFCESRLQQRRQRPAAALAAARRAVELDPQRQRWRDHLTALLAEAGRHETVAAAESGMESSSVVAFPATRSGRRPGSTRRSATAPHQAAAEDPASRQASSTPKVPRRRVT